VKLIYCPRCHDLVLLTRFERKCACSESWGHYLEDGVTATIGGAAIPIGIDNESFHRALRLRPRSGPGMRFSAFVIQRECGTVVEGDEGQ
jgi:hypothetical protein